MTLENHEYKTRTFPILFAESYTVVSSVDYLLDLISWEIGYLFSYSCCRHKQNISLYVFYICIYYK